ncbi:unnamed protein product, partial [Notodromas monacha]
MTGIENQTGTAEAQSIFTSINFLPNLTSLVFPNLLVHTTEGPVLGKQEWSPENRFYRSFRGIPFAQPPVGKLRFEPPQPVPYWWGVRLATNFNNPCLTYLFWITLGEEDCLYINVFTPGSSELANSEGLVPVIFWVHGGSFYSGSELQRTLYLPGTFIDRGVIFVSFNYRLGPLGFMTTDDAVIPGNYGAKDMVAALYWVQRNIRKFGGDPNKVTLLGQSSGAVSAHALTLSPLTTGLYHAAICMSGSMFSIWGVKPRGKRIATEMAKKLNCPNPEDSNSILKCMRKKSGAEVVKAMKTFFYYGIRYAMPFGIAIDSAAAEPFMPQHPLQRVQQRAAENIPMIFGALPEETKFFQH